MARSAADGLRRYKRKWARGARAGGQTPARAADARAGSRHKLYPCCGRRRSQCNCNWDPVERCLDKRRWKEFVSSIKAAELLKLQDTQDVGPALNAFADINDLAQLWAASGMYRPVLVMFWGIGSPTFCAGERHRPHSL